MGRSRIAHAAAIICTILIVGLSSYTGYANDKIIKVGIQQNPPLAYKDSDGTFKGLGVDVIEYIAAIEGWRLQYIHCPWSKCLEMLKSGETDLQIIIAYSKERAKKYDFTRETLFNNWGQVYIRPGSKIVSLLDLEGKKVSFVTKNIHAIAFKKLIYGLGINCKLIEVAYNKSAFKLVSEREADAAVTNRTWGELNAKGYGLEKTSIIFNPIEIRQAVLKDRNQDILNAIDRHLKALKENKGSIYHQSLANLFGSIVKTETPRWVKWSLASSATIIILFALIVAILRYRINQKAKEITERKQIEEALREKTYDLGERVKELGCLYGISNLIEKPDISIDEIFQGVVEIIPPSWQYPEITCSRIIFEGDEYRSKGFIETTWRQSRDIFVHGNSVGSVEVYFFEEKSESFEGPFLKEERDLINAIAERLGKIIERIQAEAQIKASLKEKEVLLSEIHHRVKNNMQVVSSLLKIQSDKIKDKQYAGMFKESQDRVRSMSLVHEKLYRSEDFANVDFQGYIMSIVNGLFRSYGIDTNKIALKIESEGISLGIKTAIPCGLLINELVSNSLKYAFPEDRKGEIRIALRSINDDELELIFSDDGIGIPEDLDIRNTESLGLELVMILAEDQLEGKVELDRTKGTKYNILLKRQM